MNEIKLNKKTVEAILLREIIERFHLPMSEIKTIELSCLGEFVVVFSDDEAVSGKVAA